MKAENLNTTPLMALRSAVLLLIKRYLRFGVVGASGVAVDMAALFVLADPRMLQMDLSLSKALAAEIAICTNFLCNERWTFGDIAAENHGWRGQAMRFGKFNLICFAGVGLGIVLLNFQVRFFEVNMYVGNLIAILLVSLWNFSMSLKFGWNRARVAVVSSCRNADVKFGE